MTLSALQKGSIARLIFDVLPIYISPSMIDGRYGKIIIAETFLRDEDKTIPPLEMGGQAGGQKFLFHGILFKYALGV